MPLGRSFGNPERERCVRNVQAREEPQLNEPGFVGFLGREFYQSLVEPQQRVVVRRNCDLHGIKIDALQGPRRDVGGPFCAPGR